MEEIMAAGNQTQQVARNSIRRRGVHTERPTGSVTITVGCKLPHGMHLDIRHHGQTMKRVTLNGIYTSKKGQLIIPSERGGYALTTNVPKDFFDEWMRLNKDHPAVANGLIFYHRQEASVVSMAQERDELQHGLEPIDPRNTGVKGVTARTEDD